MKISCLKFLVTSATCFTLLTACQQPTGMQGGIVDNGNKPGGEHGPILPLPTKNDPGGEVSDSTSNVVNPNSALGGRHLITNLPSGFSLREVDSSMTHILDTQNKEAVVAAKLSLDYETVCQGDGSVILKTIDGGDLFNCREMLYELKASNGDRIIVSNGTLSLETLYSILRSIKSR